MRAILTVLVAFLALLAPGLAQAFCGFYVAKADTELFNEASKVALVRDGDRTVITMANDYQGELTEFAIVVPVPTVLKEDQIRVRENALIDHLDAYTAPRLVEYFDRDPCAPIPMPMMAAPDGAEAGVRRRGADALGVTIEAEYTIGEYDIVILSAAESGGLLTWLTQNGYRLPRGAEEVVGGYLQAGMKFFLARVNLAEQARLGYTYLRPLQLEFRSKSFMLPIRLGMLNARGPQELFVFALSRRGRVEAANYRTVALPSDVQVPLFVQANFGETYRALFERAWLREDQRAVFLEYAWDMSWCDPCAADPLSPDELALLGVDWVAPTLMGGGGGGPIDVFVTRLHLRYDDAHFGEDLFFAETDNRENFQGRYIMTHPWNGRPTCEAARTYLRDLPRRFANEAENLARLTGWSINEIRQRMAATGQR